ncbi:hypothetical protein [Streptomyces sp. UG1]|uniref:hypothetical protein n=1 Tax=Streptomyces sp. UG1 TaxID=3417652 RepID=UPI003CF64F0F
MPQAGWRETFDRAVVMEKELWSVAAAEAARRSRLDAPRRLSAGEEHAVDRTVVPLMPSPRGIGRFEVLSLFEDAVSD